MDVTPSVYIVCIYLLFDISQVFKIQQEHTQACPLYNMQKNRSSKNLADKMTVTNYHIACLYLQDIT